MVSIAPALTSLRELLETQAKLPAPAVRFVDKADEVGHKPADDDLPGIGFTVRFRRGGGGLGLDNLKKLVDDTLGVLDTIKQRPHAMRVTDEDKHNLENLVTKDAFGNRLRGQDQYMVRLIGRGLWLTPKGPGNYTEDPEDAYLMTGFEAERYVRGNSNLEAISYETYEKSRERSGLRSDKVDPKDSEGTPLREGDYIILKTGSFGPNKRTGFGLRADHVYVVKSLYVMSGITYVNAWPITRGRIKTVNPAVMFTKLTDDEVRSLE